MRPRGPRHGYILFETVVAMALLCTGLLALHGAFRQAGLAYAQARDYTQARFLLEQLVAELELLPALQEGMESGQFEGDLDRFRWEREVSRVPLGAAAPLPSISGHDPRDMLGLLESHQLYLGKISATVTWTRGGRPFTETVETLVDPRKLRQVALNVPPEQAR